MLSHVEECSSLRMSWKSQLIESRPQNKYMICTPWNLIPQKVGKYETENITLNLIVTKQ